MNSEHTSPLLLRQALIAIVLCAAARGAGFDALKDSLAARGTRALLILRNDRIAYEWYAPGAGPSTRQGTASLAKALVGGTSLLLTLDDKRIGLDDPASKYIPAWRSDPLKSKITIRHLATHSSGIEDAEQDHRPHNELPGWKGAFWKREPDPFSIAVRDAPVIFEPGTQYAYSNPGMAALAYAVTAASGRDLLSLLRDRVMTPLGVAESEYSIGYGRAYEVDGLKLYANWGGGAFTPRAAARVGQLMLHRGAWQGKQLISRAWAEKAVAYADTPKPRRSAAEPAPASGICWWINQDGVWPAAPRDAFAGAGAGHEVLVVVPSLGLVAVRNGAALAGPEETFWGAAYRYFIEPLMKAAAEPPYPPSAVIRGVRFAPVESIRRAALGSDNWPITWGGDDAQYASYGDGWGAEPRPSRKLSQGFLKVLGPPESYKLVNIRSESGERTGDGKAGAKASGMLMVDGVLYMWVRNVDNSQIAWSEDRGRTWQWGFRFSTSFGSPAFLNFGKNYAGARDEYVYVYSQDGPSAYESDDAVVLARVPKDRIRDRGAYEFFARLDAGRPVWTREIAQRGPVLSDPGRCQRVDAVYHPALRRYLLAVGFSHGGGWAIFDAPEPWGPWTTAFHAENWGLGETHGYRLPAKWISPDGRTMWLVFSGRGEYDAFCVRKMTLDIVGRP